MSRGRDITKEQVNEILRGFYNERGVNRWWLRPRPQLDGKWPLEVWNEGNHQAVLDLANRGREMRGT